MILGYARVSTTGQSLDGQLDALEAEGCGRVFSEAVSGSVRTRPELDRMLDQLRKGDVVVVTRYDRLARSLRDLLDIVARIGAAGAGFRSLAEAIDTTTPAGRLVLHVFASLAEFERELITDRTGEGLASARAQGRVGGRPSELRPEQRAEVQRMRGEGRAVAEIATLFRVSPATVRRVPAAEG